MRPALLALLFAAPAFGQLPAGYETAKDIAYATTSEKQKLDIYYPKESAKPLPVLVQIHGGGWEAGSKASVPFQAMAARGYVLASIGYRLSKEAVFPAQIEDCKAAIRYLRANAKKYNIDPDKIGVIGQSAGGHLAALLGTSGGVKDLEGKDGPADVSSSVQLVVDYFGPTDMMKLSPPGSNPNPVTRLFGGDTGEKAALVKKANPIEYVDAKDPPFMILQGGQDKLVPASQSEMLHEALKKVKVDSTYLFVAEAGHDGRVMTPDNIKKFAEFCDKVLK